MALNTELGWATGDDVRVLIAAGLPIGVYQIGQIQSDMNYLAQRIPDAVAPILELLDAYDTAQGQMQALNGSSESRVLTKVDVLEWSVSSPGTTYSPEREILRVRELLYQYFALSPLFGYNSGNGMTLLLRS